MLAVLCIVAAIAQLGMRRNERSGQLRRFVADVHGAVVRARHRAIDEQHPVLIEVDATSLLSYAWDPLSDDWISFDRVELDERRTGLLLHDGVCIEALQPGVRAPSQAEWTPPPSGCLDDTRALRFEPDGSLAEDGGVVSDAGTTLWIGDRRTTGEPRHALVQVFPGGLIRVFEDVR